MTKRNQEFIDKYGKTKFLFGVDEYPEIKEVAKKRISDAKILQKQLTEEVRTLDCFDPRVKDIEERFDEINEAIMFWLRVANLEI